MTEQEPLTVPKIIPFNKSIADALELIDGVAERLRSGESVAVAIVEVKHGGSVATAWVGSKEYHQLNSGAATLAARLALEE